MAPSERAQKYVRNVIALQSHGASRIEKSVCTVVALSLNSECGAEPGTGFTVCVKVTGYPVTPRYDKNQSQLVVQGHNSTFTVTLFSLPHLLPAAKKKCRNTRGWAALAEFTIGATRKKRH